MRTGEEMQKRHDDERARLERMIETTRHADAWSKVPDKGRFLTEMAALGGSVRTLQWVLAGGV